METIRIGIGDEVRYAVNLLPDVTDEDVIKRAKLRRRPGKRHPFQFDWKIGHGVNYQYIGLTPKHSGVALRGQSEWQMFLKAFQEQGGVVVKDITDKHELREAKRQALTAAREFWSARGEERVDNYQLIHGLTDDQMQRQRGQIWRWYYNEALVAFIDDELAKLDGWDDHDEAIEVARDSEE